MITKIWNINLLVIPLDNQDGPDQFKKPATWTHLTVISDVRVFVFRRSVDEFEDLTVHVEAPNGSVVARWDQLAAVESVEREAVDGRNVRLMRVKKIFLQFFKTENFRKPQDRFLDEQTSKKVPGYCDLKKIGKWYFKV